MIFEKQWTATLVLIEEGEVLLVYHQKLRKWVPPGGHVEPNEFIQEAALRETKEEVGLDAEILSDEHLFVDQPNAKSMARPFLIQLEEIPPYQDQPAHQHVDAIFVGRVIGDPTPRGSEDARWWAIDELEDLLEHELLFQETYDVILKAAEAAHVESR